MQKNAKKTGFEIFVRFLYAIMKHDFFNKRRKSLEMWGFSDNPITVDLAANYRPTLRFTVSKTFLRLVDEPGKVVAPRKRGRPRIKLGVTPLFFIQATRKKHRYLMMGRSGGIYLIGQVKFFWSFPRSSVGTIRLSALSFDLSALSFELSPTAFTENWQLTTENFLFWLSIKFRTLGLIWR